MSRLASRFDAQLWGFLVCIWLLGVLGAFGVELRSLLFNRHEGLSLLPAIAFCLALPWLLTYFFMQRLHRPYIRLKNNKWDKSSLRQAQSDVAKKIKLRAGSIGISEPIEVVRQPATANEINAWTWTRAGTHYLAITSQVEALYGAYT